MSAPLVILGEQLEQYDSLEGYCRMLGHYLPFKYCRTQQNGIPCSKILDCYFERIPIQDFIDKNYSEEEQKSIFVQHTPKLNTILDLIQKAKEKTAKA